MLLLVVLMMEILRDNILDTDFDPLMVKFLDLMKASNWYLLMVKFLALYLKM